jgi:hypothetical protein
LMPEARPAKARLLLLLEVAAAIKFSFLSFYSSLKARPAWVRPSPSSRS